MNDCNLLVGPEQVEKVGTLQEILTKYFVEWSVTRGEKLVSVVSATSVESALKLFQCPHLVC